MFIALCVAAVLPFSYFRYTPLAVDGVVVTPGSSCDGSIDAETYSSSVWRGGSLVVEVSEPQNCGLKRQSVAVQRIGGQLFIRTQYFSPTDEAASCMCRQNFSLLVPGVPERNYAITVYNRP